MELRLITLCTSKSKADAIEAYSKLVKSQKLTQLEHAIDKKREVLSSKNYPTSTLGR